jgi:type IV pilus assembly protein PilO
MATQSPSSRSFELSTMFEQAAAQFRGLDTRQPGQWPILPKIGSWVLLVALVVLLGWFLLLSAKADELEAERGKEPSLKSDYRGKLTQAVNLPELRKQKQQVEEYVTQLEKQLPGKAEMDALLSDINQAGIGRGLQFELFRPGSVSVKDYYAELPISVRVTGRYHDIGAFAADVANLSRIVTLHDLTIGAPTGPAAGSGLLAMDATARTYRYLDSAEVSAQADQKKKAAGAKK